jgi:polyphosphate kinase
MIEKIDREAANHRVGKPARMLVKVNGILEPAVVKALYRASQAGVKIDIACRGICSLRPGIPGVSDNIRVISVVDRFLEHSRIFYFENAGNPEVFVGSADWMDRNLSRRVEVVFPVEQPDLKQRVIEILKITLADNVKARELLPDGSYRRVKAAENIPTLRSQVRFLELAAEAGARPAAVPEPVAAPSPRVVRRTQRDKDNKPRRSH